MKYRFITVAAALAFAPIASHAATANIFFDDFAAEVAGAPSTVSTTNFSPLVHWDITDGTVDLFTSGGFGLPCGSAGCLDLDGSSGNAARIETNAALSFVAGLTYEVILNISGKNGNGNEALSFGVDGVNSQTLSMVSGDNGARIETLSFVAGSSFSGNIFVDHDGTDNQGILLDAVTVTETTSAVPLPAALPLLIAGLGAVGGLRMRRKPAA